MEKRGPIVEELRRSMADAERRGDQRALKSLERIVKLRGRAPAHYRPVGETNAGKIIITGG